MPVRPLPEPWATATIHQVREYVQSEGDVNMVITFQDCDICKKRFDSSEREFHLFIKMTDTYGAVTDVCVECTEHLYKTRHPGHIMAAAEPQVTSVYTSPEQKPVFTHVHDGVFYTYSEGNPCWCQLSHETQGQM